jgi:hypothetical protein
MRTLTLPLVACLAAAVLFTGCSKDDDSPEPGSSSGTLGGGLTGGGGSGGGGQTTTQLLCDKNYKLTASVTQPAYQGITDIFPYLQNCIKDDILRFNQNGTFTLDEGPSKCDPSWPQVYSGNWTLGNNNTTLTLTGEYQANWTVLTIDGTILKVAYSSPINGEPGYTLTDTWTRQ